MVVIGTRPEAIKLAPVIAALRADPWLRPVVLCTAQHREMVDQALGSFGLVPDIDLNLHCRGQRLHEIAARVIEGIAGAIEGARPDMLVVQGDTTTTFAGALAAFYAGVPVAHVEAGLRTGDRRSPFPEEANRRLTTQLASLHLAPTESAAATLCAEHINPAAIHVTGNTVIDALLATVRIGGPPDPSLADLDADRRRVLVVTAHRRESWGDGLVAIGRALARIARAEPDVVIVFPMHRNPIVREAMAQTVSGLDNVRLLEPLAYGPFVRLLARSHIVLTDSGGIQEEAPSLGKPVLVMRDTTERPEAVAAGCAKLVGSHEPTIVDAVRTLLHDEKAYAAMAKAENPYGDGNAASRVVGAISHAFGLAARPESFRRTHSAEGGHAHPAVAV